MSDNAHTISILYSIIKMSNEKKEQIKKFDECILHTI